MPEVLLVVSIDTEEDNWSRSRDNVTLANIRELRPQAALFKQLGVRPTYFTTYHVAVDHCAADLLREVSEDGRAEIAAHLHPWNTPPLTEAFVARNSMLKNLPAELQLEKLQRVTAALQEAFDLPPTAFRAGRYGLGRETVGALLRCGYQVDSSVSPFIDLRTTDDGPTFVGAPMTAYRLAPDRDVREPAPDGTLVEIPLSYGFNRGPFGFWDPVRRGLEAAPLRWLHLAGIAARAGLLKRLILSPEIASVSEMLTLSRRLLEQGVRHLHLTWHSPTLKPGLSPFAATAADVARVYRAVAGYVEGLSRLTPFRCATVSEAAALLG
ncbi:MAG TPA: hypothetical protein VGJ83_06200 [Gemmatimonadales bacterium]|jgi:hypothetical protein